MNNTYYWRIIDRWDLDGDGAEDMVVTDGNRTLLLVCRHLLGSADPATWCVAYDVTGVTDVRRVLDVWGEHIDCIPFPVLDWSARIVHNVANSAK